MVTSHRIYCKWRSSSRTYALYSLEGQECLACIYIFYASLVLCCSPIRATDISTTPESFRSNLRTNQLHTHLLPQHDSHPRRGVHGCSSSKLLYSQSSLSADSVLTPSPSRSTLPSAPARLDRFPDATRCELRASTRTLRARLC